MSTLPVWEIVNPSDKLTLVGELEVARAATLVLGEGRWGLEDAEGNAVLPLFLFGGFDEWAKREAFDLNAILVKRRAEVAACLDSVCLGSWADRGDYDDAQRLMDPAAFRKWVAARNNRRRSSLNDIETQAHRLAAGLRKGGADAQRGRDSSATTSDSSGGRRTP